LIFAVDGQPYACPIERIQRLLRLADAVVRPGRPDDPAWEAGRLAGPSGEIPIVSLRSLWGLPPLEETAVVDRQALLVVEVVGQPRALQVDACLRVVPSLPPEPSRFRLSPEIKGARGQVFKTAIPWEKSLLVILEVNDLLPLQPRIERQLDSIMTESL